MVGDLNARTGSDNTTETNNDYCETFDIFVSNDASSVDELTKRFSKDNRVNEFGKYLLYMCNQSNFIILNDVPGMGEECGNFIYISTSSCSVIDYVTVSINLPHLSRSLHVADKIESKHIPGEEFVQTEKEGAEKVRKVFSTFKIEKHFWCANKSDDFAVRLRPDEIKTCFNEAEELIDIDADFFIQKFNEGLLTAGECMKKTIVIRKERRQM